MPRRTRLLFPTLPSALRRFWPARSGLAAIEFALILPVMLIMWFGMVEVTVALNVDRKVTILSRTVADLVGRETDTTETRIREIFDAAIAVMAPYDHRNVAIVVSSVEVSFSDGDPVGTVCWSRARTGTGGPHIARTPNETVTVPAGFDHNGSFFVLAEVFAPYRPTVGVGIIGEITLSERTVWPVRNTLEVRIDGVGCAA